MSEWIDVRDDLPKDDEAYLVAWTTNFMKGVFVGICTFDADYEMWDLASMKQWDIYRSEIKVTHWMPLPEAPKKEVQ